MAIIWCLAPDPMKHVAARVVSNFLEYGTFAALIVGISWPASATLFFSWLSAWTLNLSALNPVCYTHTWNLYRTALIMVLVPYAFIGVLLLIRIFINAKCLCRRWQDPFKIKGDQKAIMSAVVFVATQAYAYQVRYLMAIWDCTAYPDGTVRVTSDANLQCWKSEHNAAVVLSALAWLPIALGVPGKVFYSLWLRAKSQTEEERLKAISENLYLTTLSGVYIISTPWWDGGQLLALSFSFCSFLSLSLCLYLSLSLSLFLSCSLWFLFTSSLWFVPLCSDHGAQAAVSDHRRWNQHRR